MTGSGGFPETVDATVRLLLSTMPDEEQAQIAFLSRSQLVDLHFGYGTWVRNNLGLWQGNPTLLEACGRSGPDDAPALLIEASRQHLKAREPRLR